MDAHEITREELYDRVWSTPLSKLGPELGLSGRGLAKLCERKGVPVPSRGYWAKLRHGKAPKRTPLPERWPVVATLLKGHSRSGDPPLHPIVIGARKHFESGRVTEDGYLKPHKRLVSDIYVSKETLPRALEVANSLYLKLERRKYPVLIAPNGTHFHRPPVDEREKPGRERLWESTWYPLRPTVVYIKGIELGLTFFELSENVKVRHKKGKWVRVTEAPARARRSQWDHDWTSQRDLPSGRLCLWAYSPHGWTQWKEEWREKAPGGLPRKFNAVITTLEREVPNILRQIKKAKHEQELALKRWEAEERERKRREEERRRRQMVKESREELFQIIEAWGEATRVEGFFSDAETRAAALTDDQQKGLLERLARARELLGGVDALQRFAAWRAPDERS